MLPAAAPTTRKQVSAIMVIALVKQFSVSVDDRRHIAENWEVIKAYPCRGVGGGEFGGKSGRDRKIGEVVGVLDIGNDIGRFPQRVRRDRAQANGPVAALAGAGHADDVELHAAAQRMALECVGDPGPDLVEGCGRFCKEGLEIHVASLQWRSSAPARRASGEQPQTSMLGRVWLMAG